MPNTNIYAAKVASLNVDKVALAIETLLHKLPVWNTLTPQSKVLLKPNLLSKHLPEKAVTTHPLVLRGVILALQKQGVTNITVADSPGGPYNPAQIQAVYDACGLSAVCNETGASLYTACESAATPSKGVLVRNFNFIQPVLDCDFIINLPKLKAHVLTGMSGAVKNLFGCVPGLQKAEFHMQFPEKEDFGAMLVDICETVRPQIHLVDGLISMEGDGPSGGNPVDSRLLLAGENPYWLDLAICYYMQFPPMKTPFLAAAHKRGLCPAEFSSEKLIGDADAIQPFPSFKHPRSHEGRINFEEEVPAWFRPFMGPLTRWAAPKPKINRVKCIGCGKCAEICPQKVISIQNKKAVIRYKNCIHCFCCHEMCPVKAIDVSRNKILHR